MGSWNATCGISHLPIRYRDPVKLLVVRYSNYKGFHECGGMLHHSDDIFQPIGVALEGKYDDYGMPEDFKKTPGSQWLQEKLSLSFSGKDRFDPVVLDERVKKDDLPLDIATASLEQLVRAVERGGVWKVHNQRQPKTDGDGEETVKWNEPYSIFMVHEYIWDQILEHYKKEDAKILAGGGSSWGWRASRLQENEETCKVIRKFLQEYTPMTAEEAKNAPPGESIRLIWDLRDKYEQVVGHKSSIHWMDLTKMLPDKREDALWLFDQLLELKQIIDFMDQVRRGIFPQFGGGSQDINYEEHMILASWVQQYCQKRQDADRRQDED